MLFDCCFARDNSTVFNMLSICLTHTKVVNLACRRTTVVCNSVFFSFSEACIDNNQCCPIMNAVKLTRVLIDAPFCAQFSLVNSGVTGRKFTKLSTRCRQITVNAPVVVVIPVHFGMPLRGQCTPISSVQPQN